MQKIISFNELLGRRVLLTLANRSKIVVIQSRRSEIFYAFNSICPHSGGPLHLGTLEDIEDIDLSGECKKALVCPWHAYRFETLTGKSLDDDIFTADVYPVKLEQGDVFIELGEEESNKIESIELFAFPALDEKQSSLEVTPSQSLEELVHYLHGKPLYDWCISILQCEDAGTKANLTHAQKENWAKGEINGILNMTEHSVPDRPARNKRLEFVDPSKVKRRGKGASVTSRIAILHALANVEQWAIDLAIDIMARFCRDESCTDGVTHYRMIDQREFFTDFIKVASDEATHFMYLVDRLKALGANYGDLPCHQGLWDSATQTKDSLMARLAIVHMVHEARGLDVNPMTIEKFRKAGDIDSVEKLEKIHQDEITHVATGQKWFTFLCDRMGKERYSTFHQYVHRYYHGSLKPPFNEADRKKAGLDPQFYLPLAALK